MVQSQQIERIKSKLPHNSYAIISSMLGGKYKPMTIKAMFRPSTLKSSRKMKAEVLEAAQEFLESLKIEW